jgi:hypothetical protein
MRKYRTLHYDGPLAEMPAELNRLLSDALDADARRYSAMLTGIAARPEYGIVRLRRRYWFVDRYTHTITVEELGDHATLSIGLAPVDLVRLHQ